MQKHNNKFAAFALSLVGALGCGAPTVEEQVEEQIEQAQNGPLALALVDRFQRTSTATHRAGRFLTHSITRGGEQEVRELTTDELKSAWTAVEDCLGLAYCRPMQIVCPSCMDYLDEIQIYAENELSKRGEDHFRADPIALSDGHSRRASVRMEGRRRYGPGGEGEGGVSASVVSVELDLAGMLSELIDGLAGAVEGLGQGFESLQRSATCATDVGQRSFPGVLQLLTDEDDGVWGCKVMCVQASVVPAFGWCFDQPGDLAPNAQDTWRRVSGYLLEVCGQITRTHINRNGCVFDEIPGPPLLR